MRAQGVDLLEYVYNLPKYTEKDASDLLFQLVSGLHYLHSLNIVHRNVKPTNIIVRNSFQYTCICVLYGSIVMHMSWLLV